MGGAGTGGEQYFSYENDQFSTTFTLPAEVRESAQDLVNELVEWRLSEYLERSGLPRGPDRFVCRVSHAGRRPMLFLPNREKQPGLPQGWRDLYVDEQMYQANFVKVALNVVTEPGGADNLLPDLLRSWFGPDAGQPGHTHSVAFEVRGMGYRMTPVRGDNVDRPGPGVWQRYTRNEALDAVDVIPKGWDRQVGIVDRPDRVVLFVTLDKKGRAEAQQYEDRFLSAEEFQWQSQNRNTRTSELGKKIQEHQERQIPIHLFVRRRDKIGGQTQPFLYAGTLEFLRWEGDKPITVWWAMNEVVPKEFWGELGVGEGGA